MTDDFAVARAAKPCEMKQSAWCYGHMRNPEFCVAELRTKLQAYEDAQPVAWLHTLVMEFGQTQTRITFTALNPFGVADVDYDQSYTSTSVPLFQHPEADGPTKGKEFR